VSLNAPCGLDYAAGHALLRGAGGVLLDQLAQPVTYTREGDSDVGGACFGGSEEAARTLAGRAWQVVEEAPRRPQAPSRSIWAIPEAIRARARGCMIGQLIGDSLGSLVEFKAAREVRRLYPEGVREMADGGVWNTLAGQPTDDSELALALARSLLVAGGEDLEATAAAYGRWYASRPFDCGSTTARALSAAAAASATKAESARSAASTLSASNGSLMRVSPIGIRAGDPKRAAQRAAGDSLLSHPHPACVTACRSYAAAIAVGIRTGDAAAMMQAAARFLGDEADPVIEHALREAGAGLAPADADGERQGWVAIAYQNAFSHLARGTPFDEALVATIDLGGDTDTNAAIAGALLGAAQGMHAIPRAMTLAILSCRPHRALGARQPRPQEYWPDDALELADALLVAGDG